MFYYFLSQIQATLTSPMQNLVNHVGTRPTEQQRLEQPVGPTCHILLHYYAQRLLQILVGSDLNLFSVHNPKLH